MGDDESEKYALFSSKRYASSYPYVQFIWTVSALVSHRLDLPTHGRVLTRPNSRTLKRQQVNQRMFSICDPTVETVEMGEPTSELQEHEN